MSGKEAQRQTNQNKNTELQRLGGESGVPNRSHRRLWAIIVCTIVVLAIAGGLGWWALNSDVSKGESGIGQRSVCSPKIIEQANQSIKTNDIAGMGVIDHEVVGLKDYQQDPSCVYVAFRYAIMTGNIEAGKSYYDSLTNMKAKNGGLQYSSDFAPAPVGLETMQAMLKALESNQSADQVMNRDANQYLNQMDALDKASKAGHNE